MSLKCANCGASVELSGDERRRLAGKFFACPECGEAKRLPMVVVTQGDGESPASKHNGKSPKTSRPQQGLLVATMIWGTWWLWLFLSQLYTPLARDSKMTNSEHIFLCSWHASIETLPVYLPILLLLGVLSLCVRYRA